MKAIIMVIASGCAIALAQPALADGISLSKGVKACKAEMARYAPALKRYTVDYEETLASDTRMWIAFRVLDAEGRLDKFVCTVDRATRAAAVAPKKRKVSDIMLASPAKSDVEVAQSERTGPAR